MKSIYVGIIGTGYQATAAITYVMAGFAVERFGWRGAFWVPAALVPMLAVGGSSEPEVTPESKLAHVVGTVPIVSVMAIAPVIRSCNMRRSSKLAFCFRARRSSAAIFWS